MVEELLGASAGCVLLLLLSMLVCVHVCEYSVSQFVYTCIQVGEPLLFTGTLDPVLYREVLEKNSETI